MTERGNFGLYIRRQKKNSNKVKWFGEKLMVDNNMMEAKPDLIHGKEIDDMIKQKRINHTQQRLIQGSNFQGHITNILDRDEVACCLQILFMDPCATSATHNTCAYRSTSSDGLIEHYEDDGEWSAGWVIMKIMYSYGP